jgi:transposase
MSIPGIMNFSAHVIVSEIGIDVGWFPSAAHLISWACICPRNDEGASKRRFNRQRKGGNWAKATLVQRQQERKAAICRPGSIVSTPGAPPRRRSWLWSPSF